VLIATAVCAWPRSSAAQTPPGGLIESATSTVVRPRPTAAEIQALLPDRGRFTFPSPYNTVGVRLTNGQDCGGADCVSALAGNGWQVMNNSTGSNFLYILVALDRSSGGAGASIVRFNKTTGETVNLGPLFDASDRRSWNNQEGWYFSATPGTTIYLPIGTTFQRYDILTHATEVVFDITAEFGADMEIWHAHSNHDGRVHSFALRPLDRTDSPGCGVYREDTHQFTLFPGQSNLPECEVDKSGQWLIIKENRDSTGEDDVRGVSLTRIIDLALGTERTIHEANGDPGLQDSGFGLLLAADRSHALPNAMRVWTFGPLTAGPLVYRSLPGLPPSPTQISFANARSAPLDEQFACGAAVNRTNGPRANEVICIRLDGSLRTLVVAPVMTDLDAIGGGPDDDIIKQPYGMLDPTGEYFFWQSNVGGDRMDAFLVHAPTQLLVMAPADTTPPTVAITAPAADATVSGDASLTATASDDTQVAGVQFKIDGVNLGGEIVIAPYGWLWHTATIPDGVHALTAVARDAAGNVTVSAPVVLTVLNSSDGPKVIGVSARAVTDHRATISWTTTQLSDTQIDYGPTPAYGLSTRLKHARTARHLQMLTALTPGTTYHYRVTSCNDRGAATSADLTFTTAGPPVVSGVTVSSVTRNSATISWTTDQRGTSQVEYGTGAGYGHAAFDRALVTTHGLVLQGLKAGTTYHYRVRSTAASGLRTTSGEGVFTTLAPPPPVTLSVSAVAITRTSATILWTTDQRTRARVQYGLTTAYGRMKEIDDEFAPTHAETLRGLTPGTTYHYRTKSTSKEGQVTISGDATFTTLVLPAPAIVGVGAAELTSAAATIRWTTDQRATAQVEYGLTTAYGRATRVDQCLDTRHGQRLSGLTPGTIYHFRVRSTNEDGQVTVSADFTFKTPSADKDRSRDRDDDR
jgi:hypothetical protein